MSSFGQDQYTSAVFARLDQFRKEKRFCDFTIRAGEFEMPVHKLLIAASSEYFDAMLRHDIKENNDGYVDIKEVDPQSVSKCVDFMYTGEVQNNIENPVELLQVAHMLRLPDLCYHMASLVGKELYEENLFMIREIAKVYGCEDLLETCDEFAVSKFHEIMKTDGFKEIKAEYLESLLSSEDLNLFDDIKCKAIMTWVNHDKGREATVLNLMKHIDIVNVEISYRKFLLDQSAVFKSPECLEYIAKTIPAGSNVEAADYPADCNPAIIAINWISQRLERFDLKKQAWIEMHVLPDVKRYSASMVLVDRFLYIINWNKSMFRVKITDKGADWEELSRPPNIYRGPVSIFKGTLCVSIRESRLIGQYDLTSDSWSHLPPKRLSTTGSCLTVAEGSLFVIGGMGRLGLEDYDRCFPDVECFDPATSLWSSHRSNLNIPRYEASACTHDGVVYVFGGSGEGYGYMNNAEFMHPDNSCWELLELNEDFTRIDFLSHSVDGMIYLVGGDLMLPPDESENTISVFNPESQSLTSELTLSDRFFQFLSAAVIM